MIVAATFADLTEPRSSWQEAGSVWANDNRNPDHPNGLWIGRNRKSVRQYSMLVVDYDDGTHPNYLYNLIGNYEWFWHTSHSHLKDGKTWKFRVYIPLAQPVSAEFIADRAERLKAVFKSCDKSTFATGRAFHTAAAPPERENLFQSCENKGKLLDLTQLPQDIREEPEQRNYANVPADKRDIIDLAGMLKHISPDLEHGDWLRVGYALLSVSDENNIEALKELFHTWSSGSERYNENEVERHWNNWCSAFDPNQQGGISKGTLIRMAQAGGWKPTRSVDFNIVK